MLTSCHGILPPQTADERQVHSGDVHGRVLRTIRAIVDDRALLNDSEIMYDVDGIFSEHWCAGDTSFCCFIKYNLLQNIDLILYIWSGKRPHDTTGEAHHKI